MCHLVPYRSFADPSPTDAIFAPSWNEFAADAHPMATWDMDNPFFYASGAQPDDPQRSVLIYDGFTSERSRTIEPSVVDGGYYYELFASCLRVYRLQVRHPTTQGYPHPSPSLYPWVPLQPHPLPMGPPQASLGIVSNGTGCDVAGEECCTLRADESFVRVHSLELPGGPEGPQDALLTPDPVEAAALVAQGWTRLCAPAIGASESPTGVCANASLPWAGPAFDAVRGPLLLYANATGAGVPGAPPLVRCIVEGQGPTRHFVDSGAACRGGTGRPEMVVGYGAGSRDGLFSREVRRCSVGGATPQRWYSVSNSPCGAGDADEGIVGYSV